MSRLGLLLSFMIIHLLASSQTVDTLSYPYKIRGTIYDENGKPLAGASILSPGDANHQLSNTDGEYYANIYSSKTYIVFSYPKYKAVAYCPDGRVEVDVVLIPIKHLWLKRIFWKVRALFGTSQNKTSRCF